MRSDPTAGLRLEFYTAASIVFGRGELDRIGKLARTLGQRALVARGGDHLDAGGATQRLTVAAAAEGLELTWFPVQGEPSLVAVEQALAAARDARCDLVIGLGGGSALDLAKAVAGLVPQPGEPLDYLEVIGRGQPLSAPALPTIAVPTTAGTGSEVTKNAVITAPDRGVKASLRDKSLVPRIALIDPTLTDSLPPSLTASTGLDALTQLIEPYVSCRAQPLTDGLALAGLELAAGALERAVANGADHEARDRMALAALMSGIALANAGLGAVHGIAAPLGGSFPIPHGVACATLLPHVLRANVAALRARAPDSERLERFAQVAAVFVERQSNRAALTDNGIERIAQMVGELGVLRGLAHYGVRPEHVPALVQRAQAASSMKGNPIELTAVELEAILLAALG